MIKNIISKDIICSKHVRTGSKSTDKEFVYWLNKDKIDEFLDIYKRYDKCFDSFKPCFIQSITMYFKANTELIVVASALSSCARHPPLPPPTSGDVLWWACWLRARAGVGTETLCLLALVIAQSRQC